MAYAWRLDAKVLAAAAQRGTLAACNELPADMAASSASKGAEPDARPGKRPQLAVSTLASRGRFVPVPYEPIAR